MARLIDADELMKSIEDNSYPVLQKNGSVEKGMTITGIKQCIEEQPTVDAEPVRHGEWNFDYGNPICSLCGEEPYRKSNRDMPKYCPNCGAKMEESDNG